MNGFPTISVVNTIAGYLTNEEARLHPHESKAEIRSKVHVALMDALRLYFPDLERAYRSQVAQVSLVSSSMSTVHVEPVEGG